MNVKDFNSYVPKLINSDTEFCVVSGSSESKRLVQKKKKKNGTKMSGNISLSKYRSNPRI